MESLVRTVLDYIEKGGSGIGWMLASYLLLRLHQLTDRQHAANIRTVTALATIKALLMARLGLTDDKDGGSK